MHPSRLFLATLAIALSVAPLRAELPTLDLGGALARRQPANFVPKYPVVLVPGFFGFKVLGFGPIHAGKYFRGVERRLRERGIPVGTAYIGLINGVEDRAKRLKAEIDRLYPTGKVNLIAHSTGGLDSREMICRLGMADRVASVTTIATPHRGTPVADSMQFAIGPNKPLSKLLKAMGVDHELFHDLTTEWCAAFDRRTPDNPTIRYFSIGGHQPWYKCAPPLMPFNWLLKLKDRVAAGEGIGLTARVMLRAEPWGREVLEVLERDEATVHAHGASLAAQTLWKRYEGRNDGMVPLWSTPHGESFSQVSMDHWDQVGWVTLKDAPAFYEALVERLALMGF